MELISEVRPSRNSDSAVLVEPPDDLTYARIRILSTQVAEKIGVDGGTVYRWEKRNKPACSVYTKNSLAPPYNPLPRLIHSRKK